MHSETERSIKNVRILVCVTRLVMGPVRELKEGTKRVNLEGKSMS